MVNANTELLSRPLGPDTFYLNLWEFCCKEENSKPANDDLKNSPRRQSITSTQHLVLAMKVRYPFIQLHVTIFFLFRLAQEHQKRNKTQKMLGENGSASENQERAAGLAHEKSMRKT